MTLAIFFSFLTVMKGKGKWPHLQRYVNTPKQTVWTEWAFHFSDRGWKMCLRKLFLPLVLARRNKGSFLFVYSWDSP